MGRYRLPLWHEDRLALLVVVMTSVLSSWMWWVPIRCVMDGPAFEWSNTIGPGRVSGAGMGGDFLVLVLMSTLFLTVVFLGYRDRSSLFKFLLPLWCSVSFAGSAYLAWTNPAGYRFRGDTMGIDVNLTWFMPVLKAAVLILAIIWLLRALRTPRSTCAVTWTRRNTAFLLPVLVAVPFQIVLLRFGPMHDFTDKLGWVLTYSGWLLINLAWLPWVPAAAASAVNAAAPPENKASVRTA